MISLQCKDGDFLHVVLDENIKSNVLEIRSQNVSACLITTPEKPKGSLAIQLPFFTMLVKNLDSFFTAEVTVSLTVLLNSRGFGDYRLTPNEATMCVQVTVALKIDRCLESDSSFALKIRVLISIMSLIILLIDLFYLHVPTIFSYQFNSKSATIRKTIYTISIPQLNHKIKNTKSRTEDIQHPIYKTKFENLFSKHLNP